ncbi:MAG: hypothetical protein U0792_19925 [Gemmataceae bacterium]
MLCRDAQFYLRLRRHAGDELGTDVSADLGRHLAGCPSCAAEAHSAESFDRAVAVSMRSVPVPAGLRDKLFTQASTYHGAVIRRKVYKVAALAASLLLATGLGFGVFSASRPKINTDDLVRVADEQLQNPDVSLREWLTSQKFPAQLPLPFNTELLVTLGTERVQGADVPVAVFRHPTERGFAKIYIFRTNGEFNLNNLRDTNASLTIATVMENPQQRGVKYVILHTVHPVNDGGHPLKPFLRDPSQFTRL